MSIGLGRRESVAMMTKKDYGAIPNEMQQSVSRYTPNSLALEQALQ